MATGLLKFTEPWSETHSNDMEEYSIKNVSNTGISAKIIPQFESISSIRHTKTRHIKNTCAG